MAERGDTSDMDALRVEVEQAFSRRKKKKFKAHMRDLEWMYDHCSSTVVSRELFDLYTGDRTKLTLFDMQTYRQWRSHIDYERVIHFRRLRQRNIIIQPLVLSRIEQERAGYMDTEIHQQVLELLRYYCECFFTGMVVRIAPPIDISTIKKITKRVHSKTRREQYLVGDLLKYLQSISPRDAFSIVGVTMVDIYPGPEWNFVLGQASTTTGCGVFSFGRFFKVVPQLDRKLAESCQVKEMWVLMRVMTHELCHIFGIKHCYYFQCSLNESSSISEAATQPLFVCPICLKKLRKSLQFNTLERYQVLLEATRLMQSAVIEALQVWSERGGTVATTSHLSDEECEAGIDSSDEQLYTTESAEFSDEHSSSEVFDVDSTKDCGTIEHTHLAEPLSSENIEALLPQSSNRITAASLAHHPSISSLPKELWHSEQLEYFNCAIDWLERAIADFEAFEQSWEERKLHTSGRTRFTLPTIVFPGFL